MYKPEVIELLFLYANENVCRLSASLWQAQEDEWMISGDTSSIGSTYPSKEAMYVWIYTVWVLAKAQLC